MPTKPQDVVVALKLSLIDGRQPYADLGRSLGMSASEVHAAVGRLHLARLLDPETMQVRRASLVEFIIHGVAYAFPASPGEVTRGMPTAWAASPMAQRIKAADALPPVWPDPDGTIRGVSVEPLYASVPGAARRDPALYQLLALIDALRFGRARERAIAEKEIGQRLGFPRHR